MNEKEELPPFIAKALGVGKEPKEFLKVERLNERLQSYDYSMEKSIVSKEFALRTRERQELSRKLGAELEGLSDKQVKELNAAEKKFRKQDDALQAKQQKLVRQLRAVSLKSEVKDLPQAAPEQNTEASEVEATQPAEKAETTQAAETTEAEVKKPEEVKATEKQNLITKMRSNFAASNLDSKIAELQEERLGLERAYLSTLANTLPPNSVAALSERLGKREADGSGSSLSALDMLQEAAALARAETPRVFALKFFGDTTASQVGQLRQEVSAVLRTATPGTDEVVLILNTGGGTVSGYGLAAAQLVRLKNKGLKLTVCVEEVAASGGYMMACVADHLVASPFAILGSIGVITEQPNVYERLKKEGISFNTITAGKFKRTLTPTKKVDPLDKKKLEEDLAQILVLFKGFVAENRPKVEIDKIATGEIWLGADALKNDLVDELLTPDEVLMSKIESGAEVFTVTFGKQPSPLQLLTSGGDAASLSGSNLGQQLLYAIAARLLQPPLSSADALAGLPRSGVPPTMLAVKPPGEGEAELRWGGSDGSTAGDSWTY